MALILKFDSGIMVLSFSIQRIYWHFPERIFGFCLLKGSVTPGLFF